MASSHKCDVPCWQQPAALATSQDHVVHSNGKEYVARKAQNDSQAEESL